MKQGYNTIVDMAKELQRQMKTKKDYIVPTSVLTMTIKDKQPKIHGANHSLGITPYAHGQIGQRLGIHASYYNKMLADAPELLSTNVNHWFHAQNERRMLRTLDGNLRGFLSDRFRPIDHVDLTESILPKLTKIGARIVSCALTETKLYIKAIISKIRAEIRVGDVVEAGLVVSNSEVGAGAVLVEPYINRLVCLNGLIVNDAAIRKYHIGKIAEEENGMYSHGTLMAANRALFMKVNDVVDHVVSKDAFQRFIKGYRIAANNKIERNPINVVEDITGRFQLTEDESTGVLNHLISGGDLTQWGLANALTRASQDVDDYDRATAFERFGGQVMSITEGQWQELAVAKN